MTNDAILNINDEKQATEDSNKCFIQTRIDEYEDVDCETRSYRLFSPKSMDMVHQY